MKTIGIILGIFIAIGLQVPAYIVLIANISSSNPTYIIICKLYTFLLIAMFCQQAGINFYKWFKSNIN